MVIKVYVSYLTGSSDIRKKQNRVIGILESHKIDFESIDISDPKRDEEKKFVRTNGKAKKQGQMPITPQIFRDEDLCGDYDDFDVHIEDDQLYEFLKLAEPKSHAQVTITLKSESDNEEEKEADDQEESEAVTVNIAPDDKGSDEESEQVNDNTVSSDKDEDDDA